MVLGAACLMECEVQISPPTGRIFALPVVLEPRPIQYCFNTLADAHCGFRACFPKCAGGAKFAPVSCHNWLHLLVQNVEHVFLVDQTNRQLADNWVGVSCEGARPLGAVLVVLPPALAGRD